MDPLVLGLLVAFVTIAVLFSGISVANGLLEISAGFLRAQPLHRIFSARIRFSNA